MAANILTSYGDELARFIREHKEDEQVCKRALELKTDLEKITSPEAALELFRNYSKNKTNASQFTHFAPLSLSGIVQRWERVLTTNEANRKATRSKIAEIALTPEAEALRKLCLELLDNSHCILECRFNAVIGRLNKPEFTVLADYMLALENAAFPVILRPGDILARTPRNSLHAQGLQWMANISAKYSFRHLPEHALNSDANDFMQDVLIVYNNIFPVPSVQTVQQPDEDDERPCCIVS
ncbi:hypothetical protein Lqui_1882 [Legionella quinlivanii]|uniref:Uncharacterized protein n=1 Tax=Legionella quinlivanii TaxID=45073 RepID=A0A0W0XY20_9GAMM|nr:hypothetical protein [Legionella quinlivanii]KTD49671.1 hypothetical protein Lqui_1882 [Legionella quinlivanii]MCW8451962.1 hypothetical protein [Legionella quinlivanii]SEG30550.1 hypothetical protein SAMN02746093_02472 [Legionella quinlivanii DSM 21216]STY09840.1 Uncharacterised protein [Legionella quinlivanii]